MATSRAQSLLDKISQGHLECCICAERFKEPKMLVCQHSCCLKCLQDLKKTLEGGPILVCPLCRQKTLLTGNNVADLPTDIKLTALLDEVSLYEKQLEMPKKSLRCDEHDQKLNIYCDTCKKLECTTCIVLKADLGHTDHTFVGLPEALKKYKQELAQLVPKVQQKIVDQSADMENAAKSYRKFQSKVEDIDQKISHKADSEVERIREEEKRLKQDAARFYTDNAEAIKTIYMTNITSVTQAEHKLGKAEQLMAQANSFEILPVIEKSLQDIKKLTEVQQNKVSDDRSSFIYLKEDRH